MNNKILLNYNMNVFQIETTSGVQWVAKYPALKEVSGGGNTPDQAIESLKENAIVYLEFLIEQKDKIPPYDKPVIEESYSGNIPLRIPKKLHQQIKEIAQNQGVSLNSYIRDLIQADVTSKEIEYKIFPELLLISENTEIIKEALIQNNILKNNTK